MPILQVRDLPEQIYQKLKEQAIKEQRSITQQAIITLAKGLEIELNSVNKRKRLLSIIKEEANLYSEYELSNPVDLIREDRNR